MRHRACNNCVLSLLFNFENNDFAMNSFFFMSLRVVLVFIVACVIQYIIPWYFLAAAGVVAGFFMLKTSNDRASAWSMLIGSALFGVFAYVMAQIFPVTG